MTVTSQRFFAARPESIGHARKFITGTLAAWGVEDRAEDVQLCVSELATNALVHGSAGEDGFLVRLHADGEVVCLEVHDRRRECPEARQANETELSGRGLMLVGMLADGWGVERRDPFGKVVWSCFKVTEETAS